MPVINRIAEFHDDMTEWRHDLHRHPELSLQEVRTSGIVQEKLRAFGVDEVHTGLATTGVVGVIHGREPGPGIGLRADMDALPIVEQSGAAWSSGTPGVMHACGHDGHTTMLLGAARYLAETRNFAGTAYVIFQPAEERYGGGNIMVKEGLFDRFPMDQVYGLHNWPAVPEGVFLFRPGPVMAAVATFEITVSGKGAHGAMPHNGVDPIVVSAAIITAFQSIVARNVDPAEGGVVTVGAINGGDIHNVIPGTVTMLGTARWFAPAVGDIIEQRVRSLATSIAEGFGAVAEVNFRRSYPATINDPEATERARQAAETVCGAARVKPMVKPTMGGEDFSFMLEKKQGAYLMLGTGKAGANSPDVHNPAYDFNDAVLPVGASWFVTLVEQLLPRA